MVSNIVHTSRGGPLKSIVAVPSLAQVCVPSFGGELADRTQDVSFAWCTHAWTNSTLSCRFCFASGASSRLQLGLAAECEAQNSILKIFGPRNFIPGTCRHSFTDKDVPVLHRYCTGTALVLHRCCIVAVLALRARRQCSGRRLVHQNCPPSRQNRSSSSKSRRSHPN